jgi:peptidoglycan/LPS O-acetylase OafA/YrhL
MDARSGRIPLVNALKAFASQFIVLHHLAFYGPMSDNAHGLMPAILDWLSDYARIAVQVFLVVSGFLAAKSLAPRSRPLIDRPLALIWNRYARLAIPYTAAIGLAIICATIARAWMQLESVPAAASAKQLLAHILLLQNVLGYEALSAGVWYVAIDFQLYALMVVLLWFAQRIGAGTSMPRYAAPAVVFVFVSVLTAVSLFHFNRNAAWDDWALYFFGAYGLGALAFWASCRKHAMVWLCAIGAIGLAALLIDFRSRIATALLVALLLGFASRPGISWQWLAARPLAFLGQISYSVFLVHYPVCLVINAVFARFAPDEPLINAFGLFLAWGASILAGILFYRRIEHQADAWQSRAGHWLARKSAAAR